MMVAPRNMRDGSVSPRVAIVDAQFKMCMHNYPMQAPVTGEVRSGVLGGVRGAVRIVGADQVLIVAVDGVDERRLIV